MTARPFDLTPTDLPSPWQGRFHDQLGSTSDEALALVRAGEVDGPTLILTHEQTAGRGRGRAAGSWTSTAGNLAISFIHFPHSPVRDWPALSYMAGLVLARTLRDVCGFPEASIGLKWPNDVFISGGKVAGLLLETVSLPQGRGQALVLGLGLNIETAPTLDRPDYIARDLRSLGYDGSARDVVLHLINGWAEAVERFDREPGPRHQLFRDWQARALYLGEDIRVRLDGDEQISGQFIGLDQETGALRLKLPGGKVRTIMAGDVMLASAPHG
ncbi:MAG: biotin--[acetyl-CoA-carboxylase] ligase [Alphaproteobacteria bacterium]